MSTRKTDRDIVREDQAHRLNAALIGTGIKVVTGTRFGVTIDRLNRHEAVDVIEAILAATGRQARQDIRDIDPILPRPSP